MANRSDWIKTWPKWLLMSLMLMGGCTKSDPATVAPPTPATASRPTEPPPKTVAPTPSAATPTQANSSTASASGNLEPGPEFQAASVLESGPPVESISSEDLTVPQVLLSEAHQKTCLLTIGDAIPNITVTDIEGTNHQLPRLLSDRLTVLLFWNEQSALAMEQFRRLPVDVLAMFAEQGVKVIAINVGGEVARVRQLTGDAADKIVSLVDTDAAVFQQFATSLLPRTYVLDPSGRILWFDVEYSQSTQRSLANALAYFLVHES